MLSVKMEKCKVKYSYIVCTICKVFDQVFLVLESVFVVMLVGLVIFRKCHNCLFGLLTPAFNLLFFVIFVLLSVFCSTDSVYGHCQRGDERTFYWRNHCLGHHSNKSLLLRLEATLCLQMGFTSEWQSPK